MRKIAFSILGIGVIVGLGGMWSAAVLTPWAFIDNKTDYSWLAITLSPLALTAVLIAIGLTLLRRSPKAHNSRSSRRG